MVRHLLTHPPLLTPVQSRIFSDDDLKAMHALYDPSGRGTITRAQVNNAFRNLGLKPAPAASAGASGGGVDIPDAVDAATFVRIAREAIGASA